MCVQAAQKIFGGEVKNHLLLFISKSADDFQAKLDEYKTVAPEFKGKVSYHLSLWQLLCNTGQNFTFKYLCVEQWDVWPHKKHAWSDYCMDEIFWNYYDSKEQCMMLNKAYR